MTFDPSKTTEHTVDEVVDAVSAHPGLAADVLAAERGRTDRDPRVTLIERIEALQAAESGGDGSGGDPAPDGENGAEGQPEAGSGEPDGTERTGEATGVPREGIEVAPGGTATLTGDGTPGQQPQTLDDGMAASRVTPDVEPVDMTQESVMAGDPMSDENRGSRAVESAFEQPGAVVSRDE